MAVGVEFVLAGTAIGSLWGSNDEDRRDASVETPANETEWEDVELKWHANHATFSLAESNPAKWSYR